MSMTEGTRLAGLVALHLLDTAPEKEFDDLVRLALAMRETPRNVSFRTHAGAADGERGSRKRG